MNELREFLNDPVVIGFLILFVLIMVGSRWFFKRMEMNPADGASDLDDAEGSLSDAALQSKVGTPRARRLQPARAGASDLNLPELNTAPPAASEVGFPADSLAMAGEAAFVKKSEPAKLTTSLSPDPVRPEPSAAATGLTEIKKDVPAPEPIAVIKEPIATLPPLAPRKPDEVAESVGKKLEPFFGGVSIGTTPVETTGPKSTSLPPLKVADAGEKKTPDVPPVTKPGATADLIPLAKPPTPEVVKPVEKVDFIAPPAPLTPEPAVFPVPMDDLNDVKKQKTPPLTDKPEAATSGLILIPKAPEPAPEPKAVETQAAVSEAPAKAETPATPVAEPASFLSKMMGRPRIFMPPAAPAPAKPEPEIPAKVEPTPAAAEAVPETAAALPESKPPVVEAPAAPAPAPVKSEETPAPPVVPPAGSITITEKPATPPAEPAKPVAETVKTVPVPPVVPPAPVAKIEAPAKPEPTPVKTADKPAAVTPTASLVAEAPAAAKPAPEPAPAKPATTIPSLVPATPAVVPPPVPAAELPAVSVTTPQRTMAQHHHESTTAVPANARAAAQLTLGFEITSLQLTPFFKLGAVQLRPLSNVVSLHLIASATADNPLAAGISFQIVTVELNEASHLKSILLKPLPQAQPATVPSQKLQVDNVQITHGGDNSPISVTTSETTSTAVQLLADFTIAAMDFTPSFEIGSLRLEPTSNSVLLRLAPSQRPAALDLPPSFEVANVQLGNDAQLSGVRLTPGGTKSADVKS